MTVYTFPRRWGAPLTPSVLLSPVCSGPHVLVADAKKLCAFVSADGSCAWSVERAGDILPVIVVDGGCIAATSELDGMRVEMFDHDGRVVWELAGRWDLCPLGLVGARDLFLLSGARRDAPSDTRLWEMSAADGSVLRSVPGSSRLGIIAIEGGWAWVDTSETAPRLRVLDADGDRVVATGDFKALASTAGLLLADAPGQLRSYERDSLAWERPGGKTRVVAADVRGIACGHRDGDGLWICSYALDGTQHWKSGPYPGGYPTLVFWGDLLIASGLYLGQGEAVAILDRADGRVLHLETGGWEGSHGSVTVDSDAAYVLQGEQLARRDRRAWKFIEDAWEPAYAIAFAAQLAQDDDGLLGDLPRELDALRAAGVTARPSLREVMLPDPIPDLTPLRDAIRATREAGRRTYDRLADAVAWAVSASDWPLWGLDLPDDLPERRVELVMFDQEVDGPLWNQRARIATYAQLRLLSMRSNALRGALEVDLAALPRLEYLSLSENVLASVPPEIRASRSLIHLNLRDNRLTSIDPGELPSSLRWLDIGQNHLSEATVARIRVALPDCKVESYAQKP